MLHILRFRPRAKAHSFRCSSSPCQTRFAGLRHGQKALRNKCVYFAAPSGSQELCRLTEFFFGELLLPLPRTASAILFLKFHNLLCPLLLASHCFLLRCSVFKVQTFQSLSRPDGNTQSLECFYLNLNCRAVFSSSLMKAFFASFLSRKKGSGGPKWTRTTDLAIISRAL